MKKITLFLLFLITLQSIYSQRLLEDLDRGVVAINKGNNQLFISWRLLATDPDDIMFNLYRQINNGTPAKLNTTPLNGATNYLWNISGIGLSVGSRIFVTPVIDGVEGIEEGSWTLLPNLAANRIVKDIDYESLPAGYPKMHMKYCWVGDLNGDKKYDYVIDRQGSGLIDEEEYEDTTSNFSSVGPLVEAYSSEGEFLWRIFMGNYVNTSAGHNDMVTVFDMNGDGKAEVLMAVSEGTTFADGYQIKNTDGTVHDYSNSAGSAPQWVAIVNGQTGEMIDIKPLPHFDNITTTRTDKWKNVSGHFIIQYLDGIHPALIYQYKNRQASGLFTGAFAAWEFKTNNLELKWANLIEKNDTQYEAHQVRAGDIDGDGKDEFVEISYALDHDGSVKYYAPNVFHGDRHTLADIDPDRPGLEHFFIQQSNIKGMGIKDALTGEEIKGIYMSSVADVGRGTCAAFDTNIRGMQFFSTMNNYALYDSKGNQIPGATGAFPAEPLWWGPNLSRYMVSAIGSGGYSIAFHSYNQTTKYLERVQPNFYNEGEPYYLKSYGAGRAAFWGDILGDWREEMVLPRRDTTGFAIVSSWDVTTHRQYCLMQNPGYRIQTTAKGYYQTADVDFYMASDMPLPPVAPVQKADVYFTDGTQLTSAITNEKSLMIDIRNPNNNFSIDEDISPTRLLLMNPKGKDHTIGGSGKITGETDVVKSMQGDIILNGNHDYSGTTRISEGRMFVNGSLAGPVQVNARGVIGGVGTLYGGVVLETGLNLLGGRIEPGIGAELGKLTIMGTLELPGRNNLAFDVDQTKAGKNDTLHVVGDFIVNNTNNRIIINPITAIQTGELILITYTGTTNATKEKFNIVGLEGVPYTLKFGTNTISIELTEPRVAGTVVWNGNQNGIWDFETANFLNGSTESIFVPGDSIVFNDDAYTKNIIINETMPVSGISFLNNSNFTISGKGGISGEGGILKTDSGKVSLLIEENSFTGKIDFSNGILEVTSLKDGGLPSSIGASSVEADNWIMRNATLETASQMATNRNMSVVGKLTVNNPATNNSVVITGDITGENISLELIGAGALNLQGTNSFSSVRVVSGTLALGSITANNYGVGSGTVTLEGGTLQMRDANSTSTVGPWTNQIDVPEGKSARWNLPARWNFTNQLIGKGTLSIYVPYVRSEFLGNWSLFEGILKIIGDSDGGQFRINNNFGYGKAILDLGSNMNAFHLSTGRTIRLGGLSGVSTSKLSGNSTTWLVGGNNVTDITFAGVISGTDSKLIKEGTGTQILSNNNTYTGTTDITNGTLWITNPTTGSATGTGNITVRTGGRIGGTGRVSGNVSIFASSHLWMQDYLIKAFNIGGTLAMVNSSELSLDINSSTGKSDQINVGGRITVMGNLALNNISTTELTEGTTFKIFSTTQGVAGTFVSITPELNPGLEWDQSRLASEGIISVQKATGINDVNASKKLQAVEYYDITGRLLADHYFTHQKENTEKYIVIERQIFTDGTTSVCKVLK